MKRGKLAPGSVVAARADGKPLSAKMRKMLKLHDIYCFGQPRYEQMIRNPRFWTQPPMLPPRS